MAIQRQREKNKRLKLIKVTVLRRHNKDFFIYVLIKLFILQHMEISAADHISACAKQWALFLEYSCSDHSQKYHKRCSDFLLMAESKEKLLTERTKMLSIFDSEVYVESHTYLTQTRLFESELRKFLADELSDTSAFRDKIQSISRSFHRSANFHTRKS